MEPASPSLLKLKVAVLGSPQVGKRTFIHKMTKKQNEHLDSPQSINAQSEVHFHLTTTKGPCQVTLVLLDFEPEEFQKDEEYQSKFVTKMVPCDTALLIFSLTDRQSYKNIPSFYKAWNLIKENYPCVLVATKVDDGVNTKIKQKHITYHRKKNLMFYNISTKAAYNFWKPILFLLRKTLGDPNVQLINVEEFIDLQSQIVFNNQSELEKEVNQWAMVACVEDEEL